MGALKGGPTKTGRRRRIRRKGPKVPRVPEGLNVPSVPECQKWVGSRKGAGRGGKIFAVYSFHLSQNSLGDFPDFSAKRPVFKGTFFGGSDALDGSESWRHHDHLRFDLRHHFAVCADPDGFDRDNRNSASPQLVRPRAAPRKHFCPLNVRNLVIRSAELRADSRVWLDEPEASRRPQLPL